MYYTEIQIEQVRYSTGYVILLHFAYSNTIHRQSDILIAFVGSCVDGGSVGGSLVPVGDGSSLGPVGDDGSRGDCPCSLTIAVSQLIPVSMRRVPRNAILTTSSSSSTLY